MTCWYATLLQWYGDTEYCIVQSDGFGNNESAYFCDEGWSADRFINDLSAILASGDKITLCIEDLGVVFAQSERETLWRRLIRTYGSTLYELRTSHAGRSLVAYFPREAGPGSPKQPCSVVLVPPGTITAFYSYHKAADPPFDIVRVGSLGCAFLRDDVQTCIMRSLTSPPSAKDIDNSLRGTLLPQSVKDLPQSVKEKNTVVGSDIIWIMEKTSETITQYDPGEFTLEYTEIVSRYKRFSDIAARKIAVIEICRRYGIKLSVGDF